MLLYNICAKWSGYHSIFYFFSFSYYDADQCILPNLRKNLKFSTINLVSIFFSSVLKHHETRRQMLYVTGCTCFMYMYICIFYYETRRQIDCDRILVYIYTYVLIHIHVCCQEIRKQQQCQISLIYTKIKVDIGHFRKEIIITSKIRLVADMYNVLS